MTSGLGGLFDRLTALACSRGCLLNGFTALAGGRGGLFNGLATLAGSLSGLLDGFATLACSCGGLLNGLTILWRRLGGLSDGLRLLRHRLSRFCLRGIDGLYAGRATLLDTLDAFDVRGGGLLGRSGGTKETSGEEQSVHWERWVRTDFWNSFSTRCSYSANALSSWCSAR